MPLLDTNHVLSMDLSFHPLFVKSGSTSRSKRGRTGKARSNKETIDSDDKSPLSSVPGGYGGRLGDIGECVC